MIPDSNAVELKMEHVNGPNRLLAATFAYRILKMFTEGTTQRALHEKCQVKAKQLTLCITRRRYLRGTDQKTRKRHASEGDTRPSASKKPTIKEKEPYLCPKLPGRSG